MHNNFSFYAILIICCCPMYDMINYFFSQNICTPHADTTSQPTFLNKVRNVERYWECVRVCVCVRACPTPGHFMN